MKEKGSVFLPHTAGRYAAKRFRKAHVSACMFGVPVEFSRARFATVSTMSGYLMNAQTSIKNENICNLCNSAINDQGFMWSHLARPFTNCCTCRGKVWSGQYRTFCSIRFKIKYFT